MSVKSVCITIQFGFVGMLADHDGLINVVKMHDWYEQVSLNNNSSYILQINKVLKRMIDAATIQHDKVNSPSKGFGHVLVQSIVVIED